MKRPAIAVATLLILGLAAHAEPKRRHTPAGLLWDTIPHIVDGSGWKTTITLVNLATAPRRYKIAFRGDDGAARSFDFVGRGSGSTFSGEIPRGGLAVLETTGSRSDLASGWAALDGLETDYEIGLAAVFAASVSGRPDFEATVSASAGIEYDSILPFDNARGFVTSMAVLNPSPVNTTTIPLTIYDENGSVLRTDSITLTRGQKIAFATNARWPELAGRRGTIQFQGLSGGWSVLGFRFHPSGSFTTVNVMEP
jgi:hypothetical protein